MPFMWTHSPISKNYFLEIKMSKRHYSLLIEEKYSCPVCNSMEIQYDEGRAEIFCTQCGLVISSPQGGVLPYDYSEVQTVAPQGQKQITNFRHTMTNTQLMKHGMSRKKS